MHAIRSAWTSSVPPPARSRRGASAARARTWSCSSWVAPTALKPRLSSVSHLFLGEAELEDGEGDDHGHEDHRLGARGAQVEPDEAVAVELVDHDLGGPAGPALGHRVDDPEGFEEREHHVEHDQGEGDRRDEGEHDGGEEP